MVVRGRQPGSRTPSVEDTRRRVAARDVHRHSRAQEPVSGRDVATELSVVLDDGTTLADWVLLAGGADLSA